MGTRRAGQHGSQYVNRVDYALRCVAYERGDRNVTVDGKGCYTIVIDREYQKIELEDVGVNSSTIEAVWVTSDCIPVVKGSVLVSGGHTYRARNSPADQFDGWTSVQLQKTCKC